MSLRSLRRHSREFGSKEWEAIRAIGDTLNPLPRITTSRCGKSGVEGRRNRLLTLLAEEGTVGVQPFTERGSHALS